MKKLFTLICCAALLGGLSSCSDDDEGEGVLTDPEALIGKWQLVSNYYHYYEDGAWHTDEDYNVETADYDDFDLFSGDGTAWSERYSKQGTLLSKHTPTSWSYSDGILMLDVYPQEIRVLTETKLVMCEYDGDTIGEGDYEEFIFVRVN